MRKGISRLLILHGHEFLVQSGLFRNPIVRFCKIRGPAISSFLVVVFIAIFVIVAYALDVAGEGILKHIPNRSHVALSTDVAQTRKRILFLGLCLSIGLLIVVLFSLRKGSLNHVDGNRK